eukprot:c29696_g1_i1 orf=171-614(+)
MAITLQLFCFWILLFLPLHVCSDAQSPTVDNPSDRQGSIEEVVIEGVENEVYGTSGLFKKIDVGDHGVYSNGTLSCEDLQGLGSLDNTCTLNVSVALKGDSFIVGEGNVSIPSNVLLSCGIPGCTVVINISGDLILGRYASIIAGTV